MTMREKAWRLWGAGGINDRASYYGTPRLSKEQAAPLALLRKNLRNLLLEEEKL